MRRKNSFKYKLAVGGRQWAMACATIGVLLLTIVIGNAQEVLLDLGMNPVVAKKYHEAKNSSIKIEQVLDTVSLPFLDDFSKENIYPDVLLWLDSNAFINRTFPIAPPTSIANNLLIIPCIL